MVLDTSDGSGCSPVNGGGEGGEVSGGGVDELGGGVGAVKSKSDFKLPLIEGQVGELVVAELVRELLGVVVLDQIVVVGEILEVVDEFVSGGHVNFVLRKPIEKLDL